MLNIRNKELVILSAIAVCIVGLVVVYIFDPSAVGFYPRCPFFVLSGWKCPGCGILRSLHCLSHGHFVEAWRFNPAIIVSLPVVVSLLAFPKRAHSSVLGWGVLVMIVAWWIGRNAIS